MTTSPPPLLTDHDTVKSEYNKDDTSPPTARIDHERNVQKSRVFAIVYLRKNDDTGSNEHKTNVFAFWGMGEPEHVSHERVLRGVLGAVLGFSLSGWREHTRISKN